MKNKSRRRRAPKKNKQPISRWLIVAAGLILVGMGGFLFLSPSSSTSAPTSVTGTATATSLPGSTNTPTKISATETLPAPTFTLTPTPVKTPLRQLTRVAESVYPPPPPTPITPAATTGESITSFYTYTIVSSYPHDRSAFTQGLIYLDDIFYEGTGLYGKSTLRKVDPETGEVLQIINLPAEVFGEGITIFDDKIYQLTWQEGRAFVYNKETFELLNEFSPPPEGWGLTHNDEQLIMSDGTSYLYFRDPDTFEEISRIQVSDDNGPVLYLNELEYINGEVYANIWRTNRIARINPKTGRVTGWIILPDLLTPQDLSEPVDVLNGIAYDAKTDRLFVTGKFWPRLFEIELVPLELPASQAQ